MGNIWEIRKRVIGGKKAHHEATAIVNPINGKLVVSKNQIKSISLEYCKATLENNIPKTRYSEEIMSKKTEVQHKMNERIGTFVIKKETLDFVVAKFKKSRKRNYDFLVRAGQSFSSFSSKCLKKIYFLQVSKIQLSIRFLKVGTEGGNSCHRIGLLILKVAFRLRLRRS